MFALHRLVVAEKQMPDYSHVRVTDLIAKSNKRSRLSLQMFSLDMMAPSITTPHVRGSGMSATQLKSHRHGRIYRIVSRFHLHESSSPSFQPFLRHLWCVLFPPSSSLLLSPSNFSFALTIEMSSLSPVEQGITAQVDWFNTAVHSPLQSVKMFTYRYTGFHPITDFLSLLLTFCLSIKINRHCKTMTLLSIWWKSEAYFGLGKINIGL